MILNARAGRRNRDETRAALEAGLAGCGREYRILLPETPGQIEQHARRVVAEARARPQVLVAAGGDGTLNTVARVALGTGVPLGIVPLGTFNFFARDLGIPLEPTAAARALTDGVVRRVPVARLNEHVFLMNASFGLYHRVLVDREHYKRRFGRYRCMAILAGLLTLLHHHRTYRVELELDGEPVTFETLLIFFGLNALQLERLDLDVAHCPARGELALLVLRPVRRLELLRLALRGLLHGLGEARNLRSCCARRVEVHWSGARRVSVAVDGESVRCTLPLRVQVLPDALPVIVPRRPEPRV